jgi:hypothetical protein
LGDTYDYLLHRQTGLLVFPFHSRTAQIVERVLVSIR